MCYNNVIPECHFAFNPADLYTNLFQKAFVFNLISYLDLCFGHLCF